MIYVEYIERDRFLPLEIFRQLGDQSAWVDPDDTLVGSFGRTMRLGPMPSYLAFWKCKGMKRMDGVKRISTRQRPSSTSQSGRPTGPSICNTAAAMTN
jgi:hypothetical protein